MTLIDDKVNLAHTLLALRDDGYGKESSYERLYHAVLRGAIPAERGANGRWAIRRSDFPKVASVLGLTPPTNHGLRQQAVAEQATV